MDYYTFSNILFGYVGGYVSYPIVKQFDFKPVIVFCWTVPILFCLIYFSQRLIERFEKLTLASWFIIGFVFQKILLTLAPASLSSLVKSPAANGYYVPDFNYGILSYISNFAEISAKYGGHVGANMPGKLILYLCLQKITIDPQTLGNLIIIFSNLGALLSYLIARELFKSRIAGFNALILYFFIPSKLSFFPLLNTVTPVFILAAFLVFLKFISSQKYYWLISLGALTYVTFIFDPIPLILSFVFLAYLLKARFSNCISNKQMIGACVVTMSSFVALDLLLVILFNFDAISVFIRAIHVNSEYYKFNQVNPKWQLENISVFLFNSGVIQAVILLLFFKDGLIYLAKKILETLRVRTFKTNTDFDPGAFLSLFLVINLLLLNWMGVNRAETVRFWIFMIVFVQFVAAYYCARKTTPPIIFYVITGATVLQSLLTLHMVGLALPGPGF